MKPKHLSLLIAALLAAGGLWLARSAWRTHASQNSSVRVTVKSPDDPNLNPSSDTSLTGGPQADPAPGQNNRPTPRHMLNSAPRLAPPEPNRRFRDFTPEQRVQFARQGHGPGG